MAHDRQGHRLHQRPRHRRRSLLFFIISVGINFTIAKRLFDRRLALLGMGLIFVCDVFWNFSLTGLPQMLMLLVFSLVNYCLVRAIENRKAEKNPAALAGPQRRRVRPARPCPWPRRLDFRRRPGLHGLCLLAAHRSVVAAHPAASPMDSPDHRPGHGGPVAPAALSSHRQSRSACALLRLRQLLGSRVRR